MSYSYQARRPWVFSEEGVASLLAIRDHIGRLMTDAGCCMAIEALTVVSGETWDMMACVDYLVERGEIEILNHGSWQNHILIPSEKFVPLAKTHEQRNADYDRNERYCMEAREAGKKEGRKAALQEVGECG